MSLPHCQISLLEAVMDVQPNTIAVLHIGSPVQMPWADKVPAILEAYLGGQAVGGAVVDLLFGAANPCGKLAESFPIKLEDNPSYLYFPGNNDTVEYREGIYVGYRYYDTKHMDVRFPFGHGLSYTTFSYDNLRISSEQLEGFEDLQVSVDVTNTGSVAGKEIVQLYVASAHRGISRPEKELKQFAKVSLYPGERKTVMMTLNRRSFAYYETSLPGWYAENGAYQILIGASSRDIRLHATIEVTGTPALPCRFTMDSTLGDVMDVPQGKHYADQIMQELQSLAQAADEGSAVNPEMMAAMIRDMPLHTIVTFSEGRMDKEALLGMIRSLNGEA
jgi:beta-glucosidase